MLVVSQMLNRSHYSGQSCIGYVHTVCFCVCVSVCEHVPSSCRHTWAKSLSRARASLLLGVELFRNQSLSVCSGGGVTGLVPPTRTIPSGWEEQMGRCRPSRHAYGADRTNRSISQSINQSIVSQYNQSITNSILSDRGVA